MLLGVMSIQTARAQAAPPPIGVWGNKTEGLVVQQSGTCGFLVNGKVAYSGTCKWETPSARGGILDLVYPMPLAARAHSLERDLGEPDDHHARWRSVYQEVELGLVAEIP